MSVEVKAFHGGVFSFDVFHDNQVRWVQTRGDADVWIWLLGYPDALPKSWHAKSERRKERAWLIPWRAWQDARQRVFELARVKTLRWEVRKGMRTALQEHDLSVHTVFNKYRLSRTGKSDIWWPHASHPLRDLLDWPS